MAMLMLESTGPRGEELALGAGDELGIPVGFDSEFGATFDSDEHASEEELRTAVLAALDAIDSDWSQHLRVAE